MMFFKSLFAVLVFVSLTACSNTLEGLGKDIQDIGKSIEKTVEDNKD